MGRLSVRAALIQKIESQGTLNTITTQRRGTMAIEVIFRGPMLFVYSGRTNRLSRIVIPDGQRTLVDDEQTSGRHPDHTTTRTHYACMLIVTPGGKRRYVDLTGKSVRFGDAADPATMEPAFGRSFVSLNRIINRPNASPEDKATLIARSDSQYATNVACEMFLRGGDVRFGQASALNYYFEPVFSGDLPDPGPVPIFLEWTPNVAQLRIDLTYVDSFTDVPTPTLGQETITVDEASKIFVFNFDVVRPVEKDVLSNDVNCTTVGAEIEDEDFKWLYQLVDPPHSKRTFKKWLADSPFPKKRLPAPLSTCPGPTSEKFQTVDVEGQPSPDTSTCFFRTWDEDL